ncbi:MAG: PAS domain S-box protein [Cyclobacteriaceae bacterium]|nr:PAS domain S-box protein [Cyclobacteriaceae bacterium]
MESQGSNELPVKLLLLEDSEDDALLLLRFLKKSNIVLDRYKLCKTLEEFSSELNEGDYDLIISDYNLGGFTGIDAFKVFSEMGSLIPFIIVSGAIGEELAVEAMRLGVHDYVMKDRMHRLPPAIQRELREAKLLKEQIIISEQLNMERNMFRLLVDNAPTAIVIISTEGKKIEYINRHTTELIEYPAEEVTTLKDLICKLYDNQQEQSWVLDFYENIFNPHQPMPDLDFPMIRTKNGSPKFIKIKTAPIGSQSFMLFAEDITHQKISTISLRESQKRLEKIFDTIQSIVIDLIYREGTFLINNVNESFSKKTGLTKIGVLDQSIDTVLPNSKEVNSKLLMAVRQKTTVHFECHEEFKKQIQFWDVSATPIYDEAGNLSRIVISAIDLTERKNKEIALRNSEEKFRILSNLASDVVFEYDLMENKIVWNDGFSAVFGYSKEDIDESVQWILNKIHIADRERINDSLGQAFKNQKKNWKGEFRILCKSGEYKDVITTSYIYYDKEKKAVKTVGVIVDYTHKQKAEELRISALVEGADNERTIIARELHDNLGQKLMFVNVLLEQADKNNTNALIERASQILNKTIDETRSMSHLLMPKTIHDYGIKAAIFSQLETLRMSKKYDLSIMVNFEDDRFPAKIENNLYSLFQEILTNIIKHAQAKTINIYMNKEKHSLTLAVEDDGIGFDKEKVYLQGGLGLRNMENRVYLLKGNIVIDSIPETGTFINIEVPLD